MSEALPAALLPKYRCGSSIDSPGDLSAAKWITASIRTAPPSPPPPPGRRRRLSPTGRHRRRPGARIPWSRTPPPPARARSGDVTEEPKRPMAADELDPQATGEPWTYPSARSHPHQPPGSPRPELAPRRRHAGGGVSHRPLSPPGPLGHHDHHLRPAPRGLSSLAGRRVPRHGVARGPRDARQGLPAGRGGTGHRPRHPVLGPFRAALVLRVPALRGSHRHQPDGQDQGPRCPQAAHRDLHRRRGRPDAGLGGRSARESAGGWATPSWPPCAGRGCAATRSPCCASTRWTSTPGASRSSARGTRPASCPSLPRSCPSSTTT